jgi:flagellar biogenesis protein FliO
MILKYLFIPFLFLVPSLSFSSDLPQHISAVMDKEMGEEAKDPAAQTEEEEAEDVHAATESYETAFIKTIVVLVGLLILIVLTVWMFKKISHGRFKSFNYLKSVKILEKRPLSPKSMLYLIEVSGKQILIAESQLEVRALTSVEWQGKNEEQ